MNIFRGAFTALITPMKSDGQIDYDGFRKNVKHQLSEGIDGLVPLGTTAETPTLDEKPGSEEDKLIEIVFEEVRSFEKSTGKKIPVILGAGSNNTKDAVEYCERAKKAGADAALVVTPYYNKPSKEGIYQHFAAVSKVGIPIIVYNIAGRTGLNIPTDLLERIAELPNIAGVKEASGSVSQMMEVIGQIKNKKPDFAVFSGDDSLTLPMLSVGAHGVISVASHIFGKEIKSMIRNFKTGDSMTARNMHQKLYPIFKKLFMAPNPVPVKAALAYKGLIEEYVRKPLVPLTKAEKTELLFTLDSI